MALLTNLKINRVDLVDAGANFDKKSGHGSHVMIFKAAVQKDGDGMMFNDAMMAQKIGDLSRCMGRHYEALMDSVYSIMRSDGSDKKSLIMESYGQFESSLVKELDDILTIGTEAKKSLMAEVGKQLSAVKAQCEKFSGEKPSGGPMKELAKSVVDALPEEVRNYLDFIGKAAGVKVDSAGNLVVPEKPVEKRAGEEEDIWKGVNPAVKKQFEDLQKQQAEDRAELKKAQDIAKAERDKVLAESFVAKAKSFTHIPLKADTDAEIFKAVFHADVKLYDRLVEILKAANEAIRVGKVFKSVGSDGGAEGESDLSVTGQVNKMVDEMVAKNDKVNRADAMASIFKKNPVLYEKFRAESYRGVEGSEDE